MTTPMATAAFLATLSLIFGATPATATGQAAPPPTAATRHHQIHFTQVAFPPGSPPDESEWGVLAETLQKGLDCGPRSKDPGRGFCAATKTNLLPMLSPRRQTQYWGLSTIFNYGADVRQAIAHGATLRVLHLAEGQVSVGNEQPTEEGAWEQQDILFREVDASLRGEHQGPIVVPQPLLGLEEIVYASTLPSRISTTGIDFATDKQAHLALVRNPMGGEAYVLAEREARGLRVSLFPVATYVDGEDGTARARVARGNPASGKVATVPAIVRGEAPGAGSCDRTERPSDGMFTQLVAMAMAKTGSVTDGDVRYLANRIGGGLDCGPGSTDRRGALCPIGALSTAPFTPPAKGRWYIGFSVDVTGSMTTTEVASEGIVQAELLFIGPRELFLLPTGPENDCEREDNSRMKRNVLRELRELSPGPLLVDSGIAKVMASDFGAAKATAPNPFQGHPWRVFRVENPKTGRPVYVVITPIEGGHRVSLFPAVDVKSWAEPPSKITTAQR